jgi:hypothetical protein
MTRMHRGTWEIKYQPGSERPFRVVYTSTVGREIDIEGFYHVDDATRALNEIFAVESNMQPVFIA